MPVLYTGVAIFSCGVTNDGVRGEFLVGACGQGNCSVIGRESGFVMGLFCGCQCGEVRHINVWLKIVGGRCFGEKGS